MVCQAASQTRFRALKHENGIEGLFLAWMVNADKSLPSPQHVARQFLELELPAYRNASIGIFPACCEFPGFTVPDFPKKTDEVQGPSSLQKKLLIFDRSGNKTRVFYSPIFPLDPSPVSAATEFTQACDDLNEGQEIKTGQNDSIKCGLLPEEYDENHVVNEESEMHEDTEEINALLYSDDEYIDDGDDEVTSTDRSPLPTEDMKEDVASSNWPIKRQKLNDGGRRRSSYMDSVSSVRLNETSEYASDAESNYVSNRICSAPRTPQEVNSVVGKIQMEKDKIHESLSVLENLFPRSN